MGALQVGGLLFAATLWAVLFWGSIRILEPENGNNTFGKALAIAAIYVVASLAVQMMAFIGLFFAVAWLVFLLRLLISWYELGLLKSIGVVAAVNVTPWFLVPWLVNILGNSFAGWLLLFYGFPVAVAVVWLVVGKGVRLPTSLPRARAVKAPKPSKNAPVVAPIVAVAPPAPAPPPGDKPRLLT
jgi:hypothetical protein